MGRILLGTSGWSYDEWVGPVYKSKNEPKLRRYSSFFKTAEMDSSFYAYPRKETVMAMADNVPEYFVFTAKAPQEVTHNLKLDVRAGADKALQRFTEVMRPLNNAGMLGCILLQLPPKMENNPEKLETFLEAVDKDFRYSVEFRHPSWLNEQTYRILGKNNVAYTIVDEPLLPPTVKVTADFAYVRWHGRGSEPWYNYLYSVEELVEWVPRLTAVAEKVDVVYGYFNNHFHGYAVYNCVQVLEMLGLAEEKHANLKQQIENYFDMMGLERTGARDDFTRLLSMFVDRRRLERASEIAVESVTVLEDDGARIRAKVKEYTVEIDTASKRVYHDCQDWARTSKNKKLCKHVAKLLETLPRERAAQMLRSMAEDAETWRFDTT
ncbi:MAG: DUF72 domain-containing protein [Candidatus Caldarchaeum sp.]